MPHGLCSHDEIKAFLRHFHSAPDHDLMLLLGLCKHRTFKKGEIILSPGEVQREMHFILRGIQMSFVEGDTKPYVIAFTYAPGVCAVPESFLFQAPSPCFLTCITETKTLSISFERLMKCYDEAPQVERLFRKMGEAVLSGFIKRHIELHSLTIEQRFRTFCERSPQLLNSVPHKYIASYLGIDPTNFSKLYNSVKI